jgi:hypothetical protein
MSPYQFLCKLAKGNEILDASATCSLCSIKREAPFSNKIEGEGEIRTINYLFSASDLGAHGFRLLFNSAFTTEAQEIKSLSIELTAIAGRMRANFEIKGE